ncbi:50S ribosomal protein L18 [Hugenholtzia roseola]|uniref:50S ribosomal protein L18 n=1 Tax=Hugenholtzia roseola TaxID=1002 RepID=UPI0003FDD1D6|nr:50S ribosomal protein L18 [Hugenholtzia roseola]
MSATTIALKLKRRARIKKGIRKRVSGTAERPRLSVFRSNKAIYAQLIDDNAGVTLVSASLQAGTRNIENSKQVGTLLAERALAKGINTVTFDRNGYLYHGNVKALAEGAREGGLIF